MLEIKETNGTVSVAMLTLAEVARLLHVHPNSVRRWADAGLLRCYRIGFRGGRRFRPEGVDEFLAARVNGH